MCTTVKRYRPGTSPARTRSWERPYACGGLFSSRISTGRRTADSNSSAKVGRIVCSISFLLQLDDPGQASFLDFVENICYELLRKGSEVGSAQDVLVVFRRHILACASDPETRGRIEDLLQEALLSASNLAAIAQSRRRSALMIA